jgi:hypothetical protein
VCSNHHYNKIKKTIYHRKIVEAKLIPFTYKYTTTQLYGFVQTLQSGDCCTPTVTVSVVDIGGHIAQCHLELSDGNPVESVAPAAEVVTTPEETTPVATTPEETTPVATTPEETTPVATSPEETTPVATTPEETTPSDWSSLFWSCSNWSSLFWSCSDWSSLFWSCSNWSSLFWSCSNWSSLF